MSRRPQIAVVGSASGKPDLLADAEALGTAFVDQGWRVVCGGLGGVMEAVARGAHRSAHATGSDVIGILPTLDATSANPWVDIVVPTPMGHGRNLLVVGAADVVVALGGGSGTLSELAHAWHLHKPIVALATHPGWARTLAGTAIDHRRDDQVYAAHTPQEVVARVAEMLAEGGRDVPRF